MNDRHDGSSIDLERALTRYLVEQRISRRQLLDRIGRLGAAAALAPVIAACTGSGASDAPSVAPTTAPGSEGPPHRPGRRPSPSPSRSCSSTTGRTTSART